MTLYQLIESALSCQQQRADGSLVGSVAEIIGDLIQRALRG
jgi:hypothetical protein